MAKPTVRRQTQYMPLTKEQFRERFLARFYDPAFDEVKAELEKRKESSSGEAAGTQGLELP